MLGTVGLHLLTCLTPTDIPFSIFHHVHPPVGFQESTLHLPCTRVPSSREVMFMAEDTLLYISVGTHVMWPFLHSPVLSLVQASLSSSGLVTCTALFFWSSISISNVHNTQTSASGKTCTSVSSSTISP